MGGTRVVPGHGRICNEADVVEYRDMVTIIRDRVQEMVKKGMTLEQIKAARPSLEYDGIYGATTGNWTTDMFLETVYRDVRPEVVANALLRSVAVAARVSRRHGCSCAGARSALQVSAARNRGTPRAMAPVDFTGYWAAVITEDWRFRMVTPPKGDAAGVPLNDAGQKAAKAWDPQKDIAAGEQCRAFGAGGVMRMPIRLRVSWQDETTLKFETDNGQQVRLFRFGGSQSPRR